MTGAELSLADIATGNVAGLLPALWYCLAILLARAAFYVVSSRILRRCHKCGGGSLLTPHEIAKVQEEAFSVVGASLVLVVGLHALPHTDRGECGFRSTAGCFTTWPSERRDAVTEQYWLLEIGWYLHTLPRGFLRIGVFDTLPMFLHHSVTLVLLLLNYAFNLQRSGMLILAILNMSTPVLHTAKAFHYFDWGAGDKATFLLFTVVFIITRIILYPWLVLRATLFDTLRSPYIADRGAGFWTVYVPINALLLLLMVLQLVWLRSVLRVLGHALFGDRESLKAAGKEHDIARHGNAPQGAVDANGKKEH